MTPFSIQNLCMKMRNIKSIKENITEEKYTFCIDFEKELGLQKGNYSEDLFDFIYNIHDYKKVFLGNRFNKMISDIFDMDFKNFFIVQEYISNMYNEMVFLNRDYFFSIFKFDHDDPAYIGKKFMENRQDNYDKFIKNF